MKTNYRLKEAYGCFYNEVIDIQENYRELKWLVSPEKLDEYEKSGTN